MIRLIGLTTVLTLLAATPAQAVIRGGNLIANPGGESNIGASNETTVDCPHDWDGCFGASTPTAVRYGVTTFPSIAESSRIGGGSNFLAGGPGATENLQSLNQFVSLGPEQPEISAGQARLTASACLGGFSTQNDAAAVSILFLDNESQPFQSLDLPTVLAADRQNQTGFVQRTGTAPVPPGTVTLDVEVQFLRATGVYNDGYADNIGVAIGTGSDPPPPTDCVGEPAGSGGDPGQPGGGNPGDPGDPGGGGSGPSGVTRTVSFAGRATILAARDRLRTKLTCNTQQIASCDGTATATLVNPGPTGRRKPAKPVAAGNYSIDSLRTGKVRLELTASGARRLSRLSGKDLEDARLALSATTSLGDSSVTDTGTMGLRRKG